MSHKVSIRPQWTISDASGHSLSPRLLELLAQVHDHGSLSGACRESGASYRHAWALVHQGEQQLGAPLLRKERGKGSTLTPLAEKLVWAGHRIAKPEYSSASGFLPSSVRASTPTWRGNAKCKTQDCLPSEPSRFCWWWRA